MSRSIFRRHLATFDRQLDFMKQTWVIPLLYIKLVETEAGFRLFRSVARNAIHVEELL